MKEKTIDAVVEFWDDNVCGEHFISASIDRQTPEFFEAYRNFRYKKEHHLTTLIDWESAKGKSVLEIGLGLGADSTRWAQNAAEFNGVDLTKVAVDSTKKHLAILGLAGTVQQANAEALPFENNRFDIVYSHGVLHHTPDTLKTLKEVNRVLKPGGQFIVMFYAKNSLNYWARIQGLMRVQLALNMIKSKLGLRVNAPWSQHLENLKKQGWGYFGWSNWPHHCTDGPNCEIAYIRSWRQINRIITDAGFVIEDKAKAHLPVGLSPHTERLLARAIGFYQFAWCRKPQ